MIDTIVLRIHNLKKNQRIVDILSSSKSCDKFYRHQSPFVDEYINEETGEIIKGQADYLKIQSIQYGDTNKQLLFVQNKRLTSSHYYLAYQIRMDRDYIEFNFSVPKFIYGTNLVQFVPHYNQFSEFHSRTDLEDMSYIQQITFKRLIKFIKKFISDLFPLIDDFGGIDLNDVEINRIDICFNQHFDSKKSALKYLDYQKRIRKRYLRDTAKNKTDWGTSIFLNTKRYAAKIYHKGTEYNSSNGERNHHIKMNKKFKKIIFQVDDIIDTEGKVVKEGLQSYADRILRYEISFKNSMMSHLFRKHIFAKKCIFKKQLEKSFKKVEKIKKCCERLAEKGVKNAYKEYDDLPKEEISEYNTYKSILNKVISFRLTVNQKTEEENNTLLKLKFRKNGEPILPLETKFTNALLMEMFKVFNDFLAQFKVEVKDKYSDVAKKVMEYNKNVKIFNESIADFVGEKKKHQYNFNKINSILALLQNYTFDDLVKMKIISRSSKYEIKKKLEKLGVSSNQLAVSEIDVKTSLSFDGYIDHLLSGRSTLSLVNKYFK